jgi:hypothetical protein
MSQLIDLREGDSDDNKERSNIASLPSLSLSRKRPSDKEASLNDEDSRSENGPRNKTAAGSAEFIVDLQPANEVEVSGSPHKKRRGKDDAARLSAQIPKGVEATGKDVGSEGNQAVDHREFHEANTAAAAASQPMNSDSEQKSQNGDCGSTHKQSQREANLEAIAAGWHPPVPVWEERLSELVDYRKIHGHCNVPKRYSENTKLGSWVGDQRTHYRLYQEKKVSNMTTLRIRELESLGFEWDSRGAVWEDSFSELADYRKIHGHCNVPKRYSENTNLGRWVGRQRMQYRLLLEGRRTFMTTFRMQELESLGFEWNSRAAAWEEQFSELAAYHAIHGHCHVPKGINSENTKLAHWVGKQKSQCRLYEEGKASQITEFRIKELESLGFDWKRLISCRKEAP